MVTPSKGGYNHRLEASLSFWLYIAWSEHLPVILPVLLATLGIATMDRVKRVNEVQASNIMFTML